MGEIDWTWNRENDTRTYDYYKAQPYWTLSARRGGRPFPNSRRTRSFCKAKGPGESRGLSFPSSPLVVLESRHRFKLVFCGVHEA